MPGKLDAKYQARVNKLLDQVSAEIREIYADAITEITLSVKSFPIKGSTFNLAFTPKLEAKINAMLAEMHSTVYTAALNGMQLGWDLANEKNDLLVDQRLAGATPSPRATSIMFDPNYDAFGRFAARRDAGMNLSERVWKTLEPFKSEMEQAVGFGIADGRDAKGLAREIKKYLNEPDRLYRRVRSPEGKLVLSQAARNYHPGQGVYRSSYKNALRLTRTEVNMSYRYSDFERWQKIPFVVGIRISVSATSSKVCPICKQLQGQYPKDFKFAGWHPQCMCHQTSIMLTNDEYERYEDQILGLGVFDGSSVNTVSGTPFEFKDYLRENKAMLNRVKTPYWINDNPQYTASRLK